MRARIPPPAFLRPDTGWLRALAAMLFLVILVLSLVPGDERPHTGFSGNVEHFAAYAGTAGLAALAFLQPPAGGIALVFSAAAAVFEICQVFIPGRTAGLDNWFASSLGALAGAYCARRIAVPLLDAWRARR